MDPSRRDELAAALDALSAGQNTPQQQDGQSAPVIGPAPVVSPRVNIRLAGRQRDPLALQRTLIPPLLVLGILLPGLAIAQLLLDPDNPLSAHSMPSTSFALIAVGICSLGLGIVNVLVVKKKLHGRVDG